MNKNELIDSMAAEAGMTKADAGKALDAFIASVTAALKKAMRSVWSASELSRFPNVPQQPHATRAPVPKSKLQRKRLPNSRLAKACRML